MCFYEPEREVEDNDMTNEMTIDTRTFGWREAKQYCEDLNVPDNSPRADLPKLIYDDFIREYDDLSRGYDKYDRTM